MDFNIGKSKRKKKYEKKRGERERKERRKRGEREKENEFRESKTLTAFCQTWEKYFLILVELIAITLAENIVRNVIWSNF